MSNIEEVKKMAKECVEQGKRMIEAGFWDSYELRKMVMIQAKLLEEIVQHLEIIEKDSAHKENSLASLSDEYKDEPPWASWPIL